MIELEMVRKRVQEARELYQLVKSDRAWDAYNKAFADYTQVVVADRNSEITELEKVWGDNNE